MIKSIPLNKLVQSPRNVRRHSDPVADAELKASIAAHGLLQNLIVRPAAKGRFEVEAGERRRCAMLALADDKVLSRDHQVTCLVLEDSAEAAVETSLAENFHRLAMNPADEATAFAALVDGGATVEDVARRFGLTVRFVEGRLRLATLAPVVFEALASGEITLDIAKAFGATSDQEIQARVFEQVTSGYYAPHPDSIRRMVLSGTVRGSDPRARLVGREAYLVAGGRIERELFDDEASESWVDVALLENLAMARMEEKASQIAAEQGLAWVKPTLDPYASHARSLEAGLNMAGERQIAFQDHLGSLIGIDMAAWWRPTAANYFDRVSKQVILDAMTDVGGLDLSSRFAAVKKGDLAMSAERVFAGTYITEVEVREKAQAWVPEVMRFVQGTPDGVDAETSNADPVVGANDHDPSPSELAA